MAQPVIRVEGVETLLAKLGIPAFQRAVKAGIKGGALHFKGKVAKYPPSPGGRPQPFKTDRQRRGFFAKLRSGEIEVPYRRGMSPGSEKLGQSWTVRAQSWHSAEVGNDTTYAHWVQSRSDQSDYHKTTGWQTVEDVAEKEDGAVMKEINKGIARYLNSL